MITYLEDENKTSEDEFQKFIRLPLILKSFDTLVLVATTSTSVTLSDIGFGWIVIPISTVAACVFTFSIEFL